MTAVDMFEGVVRENVIPFLYLVADTLYGNSPEFLEAVEKNAAVVYMVSLPRDTLCWIQEPDTMEKTYRYAGEERKKLILADAENKPITFEILATGMNDYFWYRRTVSEGTKGPITYEFMKKQVVLSKNGKPDKIVWLIVRRPIGGSVDTYTFFISNTGRSTWLKTFVWLSGVRWGGKNRPGNVPLRGEKISRVAPSHDYLYIGSLFPLAYENQMGGENTSYYTIAA